MLYLKLVIKLRGKNYKGENSEFIIYLAKKRAIDLLERVKKRKGCLCVEKCLQKES